MHANSKCALTWIERQGLKKTRTDLIREIFESGGQFTDREILRKIFPSSDDLNKIRPRVNEMLQRGEIEEIGEAREGGLPVRICRKKSDNLQTQLF